MLELNPMIWKAVTGFLAAPFAGHLTLVATVAIGSSVVNYFLTKRGHTLAVKLLNRALWVLGGIVYMDVFFTAGAAMEAMFKFW